MREDDKHVEHSPEYSYSPYYLERANPDILGLDDIGNEHLSTQITIQGSIDDVRKQGGVSFLKVGGTSPDSNLQIVVLTPKGEMREVFNALHLQKGSTVTLRGKLEKRAAENIKSQDLTKNQLAGFELVVNPTDIRVLTQPEVQNSGLNWADVVNGGFLKPEYYGEILRMKEFQRVMQLRYGLGNRFISHFIQKGFQRIDVPALTKSVAESGAEVFMVKGRVGDLSLIQSPQQIKQVLAGIYGKVVWEGQAFRDDPSDTAHHLSEFTGLDIEMQLKHENKWLAMSDVMMNLQDVVVELVDEMNRHTSAFEDNNAELPTIPEGGIPVLMFNEAVELVGSNDFNRAAERKLGEIIKAKTGSSFYFVAGFPDAEKPFYTDIVGDGSTYSFDLMYNGVEISSGGLRIADPNLLRQRIQEKGFDLAPFQTYLDNFDRGTLPTGGFGVGLERLVARSLGGINVRLTTLYPKTAQSALG